MTDYTYVMRTPIADTQRALQGLFEVAAEGRGLRCEVTFRPPGDWLMTVFREDRLLFEVFGATTEHIAAVLRHHLARYAGNLEGRTHADRSSR